MEYKGIEIEIERNIRNYPHNGLFSSAKYFHECITKKLQAAEDSAKRGISFDIMACLSIAAFSVEAYMNFLEAYCDNKWNQHAGYIERVKHICKEFGVERKMDSRPLSTIVELNKIRNAIAHAKPDVRDHVIERKTVLNDDFDEMGSSLKNPWEGKEMVEFCNNALNDIEQLWTLLLKKKNIEIYDTLSIEEVHSKLVTEN